MLPDASDGWAVGLNGAMLRYTRGQWTDQGSLAENFNAVQELAAKDAWAAGDDGVIAHYDGASWSMTHKHKGQFQRCFDGLLIARLGRRILARWGRQQRRQQHIWLLALRWRYMEA
jgi:hypothetical protein